MRGGGGGKAKLSAGLLHHQRDQARVQRAATGAAKQRLDLRSDHRGRGRHSAPQPPGRRAAPGPDRSLPPLPVMRKTVRQRMRSPGQTQRLGYPQAAAIKQRHNGRIARGNPIFACIAAPTVSITAARRPRTRARQFAAKFRRAGRKNGGRIHAFAVCQPSRKAFDRRKRTRQRPRRHAAPALMSHPGPHIAIGQGDQRRQALGFAAMQAMKARYPETSVP